jgi:hypothetical protein
MAEGPGEYVDRDGCGWALQDDAETWKRLGGISGAESKRLFSLKLNVEAFAEYWDPARCGFLTLTAQDAAMTPAEFARRWDAIRRTGARTRGLSWVRSYIRVLEPQGRGAPHWHLLVACSFDLGPGSFNWQALDGAQEARKRGDLVEARQLTRAYASSATAELRQAWADLRDACDRHGLGRSELLPFRKEAGAVAQYLGKYLAAGLSYRRDAWKGARRVECDRTEARSWRRCGSSFAWVSPGAKAWRSRVGELACACNVDTMQGLSRKLGERWVWAVRANLLTLTEGEWREALRYWADEHGGKVLPKPKITVGREVVAWWDGYRHDDPF